MLGLLKNFFLRDNIKIIDTQEDIFIISLIKVKWTIAIININLKQIAITDDYKTEYLCNGTSEGKKLIVKFFYLFQSVNIVQSN